MSSHSTKSPLRFYLLAALLWISAMPALAQQFSVEIPPNSLVGNLNCCAPNPGNAVTIPQLVGALSGAGLALDSMTRIGDSIYAISPADRAVATFVPFTASRTWTLPAAGNTAAGHPILVVDLAGAVTGSNTLVIARAGTDTINGSGASVTISAAFGAYYLVSDGISRWTAQGMGPGGISSVTCGTGLSGGTFTTSGTCALALTNTSVQASLATFSSFSSTTGVMAGYGASCKLTPTYSGRVKVTFSGNGFNTTAGQRFSVRPSFGTGTAPVQGDAARGTIIGQGTDGTSAGASSFVPFSVGGIITGLTPGTNYWFDLDVFVTSSAGSVQTPSCDAFEF
jgi:hypothetical protein